MAAKGVIGKARRAFGKKKYAEVITLLEPCVIDYRESFPCFYMLGVSCMYMGDTGGAVSYLQRARQIKMRDPQLLTAQAALYLRRGDTNQAVEYYLEALEYDPGNRTAKKALQFIRKKGDPDTISEWIDSGKIVKFYPRPRSKSGMAAAVSLAVVCCAVVIGAAVFSRLRAGPAELRADLSDFALTVEERSSPADSDLSGASYRYILTEKQITDAYASAMAYFQRYRDNAAQVEVNRILYSNASLGIRRKARALMEYFAVPGFDTITDNYDYAQVSSDPYLYMDCWVVWSGIVTNVSVSDSSYRCDLLVGYDNLTKIDGIVPVVFEPPVLIEGGKPLKVLGRLGIRDGRLYLQGRSVWQPLAGGV